MSTKEAVTIKPGFGYLFLGLALERLDVSAILYIRFFAP